MVGNIIKNPNGNIDLGIISQNGQITGIDVARYKTASLTVSVIPTAHVYGVSWDGSSSSSLTRTDDAANFPSPNPYYSGMSGFPSSPFDGLMPWAGIRRVTDSSAGELVEIPKFWFKWTKTGSTMTLQIADAPVSGFFVSPAHADRGDGVGERDYVYVGRYHCNSAYKSISGASPLVSKTRAEFRNGIHNNNSNMWQWDYAMVWTVRMLYLVEFADWNSRAKIGYGGGNGSATQSAGATDSMPYHTGTSKTSRTTYGVGIQYRYIEDLWANVVDWVDGVYAYNNYLKLIKNPANFSDTSGGVNVIPIPSTASGNVKSWTISSTTGFEYMLYPVPDSSASPTTYCCDYAYTQKLNYAMAAVGSAYNKTGQDASSMRGLFFDVFDMWTQYAICGSRLMVLPSARIN